MSWLPCRIRLANSSAEAAARAGFGSAASGGCAWPRRRNKISSWSLSPTAGVSAGREHRSDPSLREAWSSELRPDGACISPRILTLGASLHLTRTRTRQRPAWLPSSNDDTPRASLLRTKRGLGKLMGCVAQLGVHYQASRTITSARAAGAEPFYGSTTRRGRTFPRATRRISHFSGDGSFLVPRAADESWNGPNTSVYARANVFITRTGRVSARRFDRPVCPPSTRALRSIG